MHVPTKRSPFVLDSMRTRVEHNPWMTREEMIMWAKDIAAGAGLLAFVTFSFMAATIAQAMFSA